MCHVKHYIQRKVHSRVAYVFSHFPECYLDMFTIRCTAPYRPVSSPCRQTKSKACKHLQRSGARHIRWILCTFHLQMAAISKRWLNKLLWGLNVLCNIWRTQRALTLQRWPSSRLADRPKSKAYCLAPLSYSLLRVIAWAGCMGWVEFASPFNKQEALVSWEMCGF